MSNKMIALTKAPYITFHKVPRDNVQFVADHKALENSYGTALRVCEMKYKAGDLSAVVVTVAGRHMEVSLIGTDCAYNLAFDTFEVSDRPLGGDISSLLNRVR